ncbi:MULTISPECIES: cupin domain-containing protein [unclassified Achromobacter]|uniref:cupin domain-containing protein n=1 Tax=unclassified Achromobacter TaxID=2626865 RepID=UPI001E541E39|nr:MULTISPECIES: cupin domain-containing protein [unclassified Achromobacter]
MSRTQDKSVLDPPTNEGSSMTIQKFAQLEVPGLLGEKEVHPGSLGDVKAETRSLDVTIANRPGCETGFWECTPGSFPRTIKSGEIMHILAGAGSFQPEDGDKVNFAAGDTLFFPADTRGLWEIRETVRKLYVMV